MCAMEQQVMLSSATAEFNIQQNIQVMEHLIKQGDKLDLDPALLDIPTFSGEDITQCLEWVMRICNVCQQSRRSFRQELINKSVLVVHNFITMLDVNMTDNELIEKILQLFSDTPTITQAIEKLKSLQQGEKESILAYNQCYRTLAKRVEGRSIEKIELPVAMEMYLGTIIPPLRQSIKNSKHTPKNRGEAMMKASTTLHETPVFKWQGRG